MATRREQSSQGTAVTVPAWVRTYVPADWLPKVRRPRPADLEQAVSPHRWQEMEAHRLWGVARRQWLSEHGIDWRNRDNREVRARWGQ